MGARCIQCDRYINENELKKDSYWDYHGYGYNTKLIKCPSCGQINILRYEEDKGFDVNNDERWYS